MTAPDTCQHQHGGSVPDLPGWVCGQCWTVLEERPKRYGMVNVALGDKPGSSPRQRQEVIWQAEERRTAEGMTLGKFLVAVAQRFAIRGRMSRADAMEMALSVMRGLAQMDAIGDFGSAASEWSRDAAQDIADEEMTYWDHEGGKGNA